MRLCLGLGFRVCHIRELSSEAMVGLQALLCLRTNPRRTGQAPSFDPGAS